MLKKLRPFHWIGRPYGVHLALTYALLGLALLIVVAIVEFSPSSSPVQRYGPDAVAELMGILVTLAVVERLLAWQRERAATPVRTVALRRIWYQLNGLVEMLAFAYKAAAPPGSPEPTSLAQLLENWQREARFLDFRLPYGPTRPGHSWHQYAGQVLTNFEEGIRDVIDRYLAVLGSDLPAAAEDVIDSAVFKIVKHGPVIEQVDAEHGYDIPRLSFWISSVDDPSLDSLTEFAELVARLVNAYDRLGGHALTTLGAHLYREDVTPAWGSARIRDPAA